MKVTIKKNEPMCQEHMIKWETISSMVNSDLCQGRLKCHYKNIQKFQINSGMSKLVSERCKTIRKKVMIR